MAPKKTATAIVKWDEKFAAYAKQSTQQVANVGGGTNVKFGRNKIEVGGLPVKGGKLECIILGSCAMNTWYKKDYDANDIQPPECYAFAEEVGDEDMKPHEQCGSPQSEECAPCEHNQFGSAKTGRGKACNNNVRLGLLVASDVEDGDSAAKAEMATAKVSPTNVKHWGAYVKLLESEYQRPPWAVVTEIQSFDDDKTQIRLEFRMVELIEDNDTIEKLEARFLKIQNLLQVPFPKPTEKTAPAKKAAPAKSTKFAGKAKR